MESKFTPVGELGRVNLIKKIESMVSKLKLTDTHVIQGIGDDCAVIGNQNDTLLLHTSETFVEGVDFDLTYSPLQHLGYKTITAAISDILAMNGTPSTMLISLGIPNKISSEMIETLYEGFIKASEVYKCNIIGGDITASPGSLIISISVNGIVKENEITYRSDANIDDALCVTGDLGAAYAGLRILLREKSIWTIDHAESDFSPDLTDYEYVVKRQLLPEARTDLIETFSKHGIKPTSMIDISKNLLQDMTHLVQASNKGVLIYQAALPIALETRAIADEFQEDVDQFALQGGEDYELLFTLPEKAVNELVKHFNDFVVIGKITYPNDGIKMQTSEGDEMQFNLS
jgi:thiamine-monophosphate kinase